MKKNFWKVAAVTFAILFAAALFVGKLPQRIYHHFADKSLPPVEKELDKLRRCHSVGLTTQFEKLSVKDKVVFLGDSHTENGAWPELLQNTNIVKRGIGGEVSNNILQRAKFYVSQQPKAMYVMWGTNDVAFSFPLAISFKNVDRLIALCARNQISLTFQSTLYLAKKWGAKTDVDRMNNLVDSLNTYTQNACKSHGLNFINVNEVVSQGHYLQDSLTEDGVHLKGNGYLLWAQLLKKFIH